MNLIDLLKLEPSRSNIDQIINIVTSNPELFDTLWDIYLQNKDPESRRAAWAIDLLNEQGYQFKRFDLNEIINLLPSLKHQGMKRHSLRIIFSKEIPEDQIGVLTDICFRWLESPASSVAVKMFAIKILTKVAEKEPTISRELIEIIEIQLDESTAGFRSIGLKTIRKLSKGKKAI
jgi:hypothetical protein